MAYKHLEMWLEELASAVLGVDRVPSSRMLNLPCELMDSHHHVAVLPNDKIPVPVFL